MWKSGIILKQPNNQTIHGMVQVPGTARDPWEKNSKPMRWWFVWYTQVDLELTRNGDLWYATANKSRQKNSGLLTTMIPSFLPQQHVHHSGVWRTGARIVAIHMSGSISGSPFQSFRFFTSQLSKKKEFSLWCLDKYLQKSTKPFTKPLLNHVEPFVLRHIPYIHDQCKNSFSNAKLGNPYSIRNRSIQ